MHLRPIDQYFENLNEPFQSCFLGLRDYLLRHESALVEAWKYKTPFYILKGKNFCYFHIQQKSKLPYIGIVDGWKIDHPALISEGRKMIKILPLNPGADLPVRKIDEIIKIVSRLH